MSTMAQQQEAVTENRAMMIALSRTSHCTVTNSEDGKYSFTDELRQRKDGQGDLTVTVHGGTTTAHRDVLMATSDYFRTMFSAGFSETNANTLDFSNIFEDVADLDAILDFMYEVKIELTSDNIECVLNVSCHFLLTNLQRACTSFLKVNISPKTCVAIFILADTYNLTEIRAICLEVMRTWFPVSLCGSPEVLDVPPQCLNVLIKEGVLKGLSDQNKTHFLQKWHNEFKKTASEVDEELPTELSELLEQQQSDQLSKPVEQQTSKPAKMEEDALFFILQLPSTGSSRGITEVHAFVPGGNMWKCVLRHMFGDPVKPASDPHLVGITSTKAYFLFVNKDPAEEFLISVGLQTGALNVIRLPYGACIDRGPCYGGYPNYFIWGEELCAVFRSIEQSTTWSLYKHVEADEWDELMQKLPVKDRDAEFITVVFKDALYIWAKEFYIRGDVLAEIHYRFTKITKSAEAGEYRVTKLRSVVEIEDEDLDYPYGGYSTLVTVSADETADTLSFTHLINMHDDIGTNKQDSWQNKHYSRVLTYHIETNTWERGETCEASYPHPVLTVIAPPKRRFETKFPIVRPCKRLVETDNGRDLKLKRREEAMNPTFKRQVPEACVGGMYYMKTTNPYSTSMWKLDRAEPEIQPKWSLVTHLPYSLDWFPHVYTARVALDWLVALPDSHFQDVSEEDGESLLRAWTDAAPTQSSVNLEFDKATTNSAENNGPTTRSQTRSRAENAEKTVLAGTREASSSDSDSEDSFDSHDEDSLDENSETDSDD